MCLEQDREVPKSWNRFPVTRRAARKGNQRFQDRLAERTRIAQDLHDTLLQGVLSASMQLDLAEDHIPECSPAKPLLRRVLELMAQVTEEGRQALRGLRGADSNSLNLESAMSRLPIEFMPDEKITYCVVVHGSPWPLGPWCAMKCIAWAEKRW